MQYDIITFGIPMVELIRKEKDQALDQCGEFVGPFPAGDPGILLNACVKLGYKGGYAGVVGADDFGECFLECMRRNQVDVSHIRVAPGYATGMSLAANFSDGSRKFIFTMPTSAAALLGEADFDRELLDSVKWIHVSGFALSVSESIASLHDRIMDYISDDVMVSFDPNYRKDIIEVEPYLKRCRSVFDRCNLFLASRGEAKLFWDGAADDMEACREMAGIGKIAVLKDGDRGVYGFWGDQNCFLPAFQAKETDPTGAGDIFGGAMVASLLKGNDVPSSMRYGCAAGAIAVTRRGLMDIAPAWQELERVIKEGAVNFA